MKVKPLTPPKVEPIITKEVQEGILQIMVGSFSHGFELPQDKFVVVTEKELFNKLNNIGKEKFYETNAINEDIEKLFINFSFLRLYINYNPQTLYTQYGIVVRSIYGKIDCAKQKREPFEKTKQLSVLFLLWGTTRKIFSK